MDNESKSFFHIIMEAEGDMEPFTDSDIPDTPDTPEPQPDPPAGSDVGTDDPPPLNESDDGDLSFSEDDYMDDTGTGDGSEDDTEADGDNKNDEKLSDKANNILNQKLYQKLIARNSEIESILEQLQKILPVIPVDVIDQITGSITKLKAALSKGQDYVVNDFVNMNYGENLLFYQKLDSLYSLLLDSIDSNLKKVKE